jgi:hypothetical protein
MTASARTWLREHPRLVFAAYAAVFAALAFARTRPVLLVNDGQMYFEMARSMLRGNLEIPNGLDLVDSPELWILNTVKRGPHLYAKYPPLYAPLAAVPYALFGIRGLYLANAIGFVFAVVACHELARRVLGPARAWVATLLLPFALPLFPYMLMELPHLVALAPFLWAIVLWDDARQAPEARRAFALGLAAGLLAGLAFGVRMQDLVVVAPLFAVGFFHSKRRGATFAGLGTGFAICLLAIGAFNAQRFGSPNPFSYGPADSTFGAPHPEEKATFFLQPAFVVVVAIVLGVALVARRCRRSSSAWLIAQAAACFIAAIPALRGAAWRGIETIASLVVNASVAGNGWSIPDTTHGWIDKALLSSAPFLVLGLVGMIACVARPAPPLETALAWMPLALLLFLSARDPDPSTNHGAMGFMSLNPRYLVEVMPALYLLAWGRLRGVRFGAGHVVLGLVAGVALFRFLMATGRDELSPEKTTLLLTVSVVGALFVFLAYLARRTRAGAVPLALLVAIANAYAAACIFAEDSRCLLGLAAVHDRWGERTLAAMPEPRLALVGWKYAKDAVFHLRASKPVVVVDAGTDDAASLPGTLDALVAGGMTPYYFGLELERVRPGLEGRYRVVPVLDDPLLWRLDRVQ